MSGPGINFRNMQEFAAAVQTVAARSAKSEASHPSASSGDTSADQTGGVPGKDFDLASFGNLSYSPSPPQVDTKKYNDNGDGGYTVVQVVSGYITGWTNNSGSSFSEDTAVKKIGTDGFSGVFKGWSNGFA